MLKKEREIEILDILKKESGFVSVKVLCEKLFASESSVRRDLCALEEKGLVERRYGGASLVTGFSNIVAFTTRSHHNVSAKRSIAKKAATLIKDNSIVFFDQSSTAFYLAAEIFNRTNLTVITNNIEIINLLSESNLTLVSSGGTLCRENRSCLLGGDAHYIFENTHADIMFFSAKSLADDGTIWDCSREEVLVRHAMLNNAATRVFLCDSEKIGGTAAYKQGTLANVDCLLSEGNHAACFATAFPHLQTL